MEERFAVVASEESYLQKDDGKAPPAAAPVDPRRGRIAVRADAPPRNRLSYGKPPHVTDMGHHFQNN